MARTRTLHGKREGWSVKLSKPKSDAADAMRGAMLRAHWLEALIDAALADDEAPPAAPPPEVVEDAIVPLEGERPCRHPSGSVEDGVCHECGNEVDLR